MFDKIVIIFGTILILNSQFDNELTIGYIHNLNKHYNPKIE